MRGAEGKKPGCDPVRSSSKVSTVDNTTTA